MRVNVNSPPASDRHPGATLVPTRPAYTAVYAYRSYTPPAHLVVLAAWGHHGRGCSGVSLKTVYYVTIVYVFFGVPGGPEPLVLLHMSVPHARRGGNNPVTIVE